MTTFARLTTTALAFLTFMTVSLATANASSLSVKDPRGDVGLIEYRTGVEGSALARKTAAGMDVTGLKLNHGTHYVSVKIQFANLKSSQTEFLTNFRTEKSAEKSTESEYWIRVKIRKTTASATLKRTNSGSQRSTVCGPSATPPGNRYVIKNKIKYGKGGYMALFIPRPCLGHPNKVRVRSAAILSAASGLYTDEAPSWTRGGWTRYRSHG